MTDTPSHTLPHRRKRRVRVLLATPGWPCGILDVGSWAGNQDLAEVVVFQLQPGYAFLLDSEDRRYLAEGPVDAEMIDAFARHGRALSPDATAHRIGSDAWQIRDLPRGWTYRIAESAGGLAVTVLENLQVEPLWAAVRSRVQRDPGIRERLARSDWCFSDPPPPDYRHSDRPGSPDGPVGDALRAVGVQFLVRLLEFDPHVVGFRLEGGGFEQVRQYVRAVRLFSPAEVVLGGPTATSHPGEVLEDTGADYVFAGEAEETFSQFLRLARQPDSKDTQPEIPGLTYRYGGRTYLNTLPRDGYERSILDVDAGPGGMALRRLRNLVRPVAGAELLAANRLDWSLLEGFLGEFDSLFFTGGRGCPGECTFCARLHGQEVRAKGAAQLLDEIAGADARAAAGALRVSRWRLFEHVDDPALREKIVSWAAIYDEDFFLHRRRAIEFFRLWDQSALKERYRLSLQTNPCSLLVPDGQVHGELLRWIDRLKPMIQLGAESFNPQMLARWHKRHNVGQLNAVLDALDTTRQDYTVFQLLTDFDTTPEELLETLRLLVINAYRRRRMRIASSPLTIPLFDCETRRMLEYGGRLGPERIGHFTDYERPQPGWMDPLTAELADLADAELRWALHLPQRDSALVSAMEAVVARIEESRLGLLYHQARCALEQIKDIRFQGIGPN